MQQFRNRLTAALVAGACALSASALVAQPPQQQHGPNADERQAQTPGRNQGGRGGSTWRNPTGFRSGEQSPTSQPGRSSSASGRRTRITQSINDLVAVLNADELNHVPGLRIPLEKLLTQHRHRMYLQNQRDTVIRQTSGTATERTSQFHSILQQEEALAAEQRDTVTMLLKNADKLTSEITGRRDALRNELRNVRSRANEKPEDAELRQSIRKLTIKLKFYEWLEDALPELDPNGPSPLYGIIMQNWGGPSIGRSGVDMNTTAIRGLMPQLRELRNRQEQLMRDVSDLDQRIMEIEDLLNIQQQRGPEQQREPDERPNLDEQPNLEQLPPPPPEVMPKLKL